MNKKRIITISIIAVLVIALVVIIVSGSLPTPPAYTYDHSASTVANLTTGDYKTYLSATGKDTSNVPQGVPVVQKAKDFTIVPLDYKLRAPYNKTQTALDSANNYVLSYYDGSTNQYVSEFINGYFKTTDDDSKVLDFYFGVTANPGEYSLYIASDDARLAINLTNENEVIKLATAAESNTVWKVEDTTKRVYTEYLGEKYFFAANAGKISLQKEAEINEDNNVYLFVGETVLISDMSTIGWVFDIAQAGFYNIEVVYRTTDEASKSSAIEKKMNIVTSDPAVNNAYQEHMSKQSYVFSRYWQGDTGHASLNSDKDSDKIKDTIHVNLEVGHDTKGNDVKPSQIEVSDQNVTVRLTDYMGYVTEAYMYYLTEGANEISFSAVKEYMLIEEVRVVSVEKADSYEKYLSDYKAQQEAQKNILETEYDIAPEFGGGKVQLKDYSYRVEAEAPVYTSSPTLYPITDRTSSNTYPYSASTTKLNSIGGDSWKVLGDWIVWDIYVPADGFYNISFRARQNLVRGMYSQRKVYIDGEIPFEELERTVFSFSSDWQNITLGDSETGKPFDIYLTAGVHQIKMEVTLGAYGELVEELEAVIGNLNDLYLDIIKYTTASPDTNRDYALTAKAELDLINRLQDAGDRLKYVSVSIARLSSEKELSDEELKEMSLDDQSEYFKDGKSDKTGVIDTMVEQIELFIENSRKITQQLGSFSTNVSSLGTLLSQLQEFPLTIDYFAVYAAGGDYKMEEPNEGFLKSLWNSVVSFFYSFVIDYSEIGSIDTGDNENEHLEEIELDVWMTLGRDQANVIRKLIDNDLGKQSFDINDRKVRVSVNLKLTGTDVLLKAALAGVGPDIAINVDSSLPVNYGLRGAALDLTEFEDYEEFIAANFLPSSSRQFSFDGATYAIPEKQLYMMMFVRTDIMAELYPDTVDPITGKVITWEDHIPQTWDEVISMMTDLQTNSLQFYLPVNEVGASALNPAFVTMLYQNGGALYSEDNRSTGLLSDIAMDTFEYWTDFYTKYSFPKAASFINRFRSGEMPIGISYYEMYNTLAVFAPEIRGNWAFYPIPGTTTTIYDEKTNQSLNVIDHTSVASGTGAIIIAKNAYEDSDVKYASWEFLKWWTSETTQASFGKEMEGILGSSARHATANFNAFQELAWPKADQDQLLKQWGVITSATEDYVVVNGEKFPISKSADGTIHLYGVKEIPQIAGSYITGREVENAYRSVINNNYNAKETLYKYAQNVNNEIDRKRKEFGLPTRHDEE